MDINEKVHEFYENGVFRDFYRLLEISPDATGEEVKRNYKRLVKIYHPDAPTGNEVKMRQLVDAYRILGDSKTRTLYDQYYYELRKQNISHCEQDIHTTQNYDGDRFSNNNYYRNDFIDFSYNLYFSKDKICELSKKWDYSGAEIQDFLLWCSFRNIRFSMESQLKWQFLRYLSIQKQMAIQPRKASIFDFDENTTVGDFYYSLFYRCGVNPTVANLLSNPMIIRQQLIKKIVLEKLMVEYYNNFVDLNYWMLPISNLQVLPSQVFFSKVTLYCLSSSKAMFYSDIKPREYTYQVYR